MWSTPPLKDVCEIRPAKKQAKKLLSDEENVSFVPMNRLGVDRKYFIPAENRTLGSVYKGYTYFADGDVLLAKITPCFENGKLGIAQKLTNKIGFGSSEFIVLRASKQVIPEYLYYFISRDIYREVGGKIMTGAVGHKRVPLEYVENTNIPLPPPEEQKRIVAILDEAFAGIDQAIENTEKNIQNARELFESYLNNIFTQKGDGWATGALSEIGADIKTGPFGSLLHKSDYIENGTPLINPAHINKGSVTPDMRKTVNQEALDSLSSYHVRVGDVVIGRRGDMGRCAPITEAEDGWLCGTGCFIIRPKNGHHAKFLSLLLSSNFYIDEITKLASGATMLNLSNKALGSLAISLPTPDQQESLLEQIDLITIDQFKLNIIYQQKLTALKELKQSLLQKAFSGELTSDMREAA